MPQNTPNAVSAVRSLCRRSVLKISCHFSMSMNMAVTPARIASVGVIFAARNAGMSPARMPTPTSSTQGGDRELEIDAGIQEVRQLRARAAQPERHQLEQAHAKHQAQVAREAGDQRGLEQQAC